MPLCSNCRSEYIKGKRICSHCGQELYSGLLTDLSEDEDIFHKLEWIKVTNVSSEDEADIIIKQLIASNIPAIKRNNEIPFEEVGVFQSSCVDIYVPQGMEDRVNNMLS